jgi:hypothetical protein
MLKSDQFLQNSLNNTLIDFSTQKLPDLNKKNINSGLIIFLRWIIKAISEGVPLTFDS